VISSLDGSDLSVVVQGDLRAETSEVLRSVRHAYPDAEVILSTYLNEPVDLYMRDYDAVVQVDDPGALPPFTKGRHSPRNNLNRQLASASAGLARATRPFTAKLRTDCVLAGGGFLPLANDLGRLTGSHERLLTSSFYTRHPKGVTCYPFHVSDWFCFGPTAKVREFFSAPPMTLSEAEWYDTHRYKFHSTNTAKRFRARFTPEQHITRHFAEARGYVLPRFHNDNSGAVVKSYEQFLAQELAVAEPELLGIRLPKYSELSRSNYHRMDCVLFEDWLEMLELHGGKPLVPAEVRKIIRAAQPPTSRRAVAHFFRHSVSAYMLWLRARASPPSSGFGQSEILK
jgi:hypothetical protein